MSALLMDDVGTLHVLYTLTGARMDKVASAVYLIASAKMAVLP